MLAVRLINELPLRGSREWSCSYDVQLLKLDARLTGGSKIGVSDEDIVESERYIFLLKADAAGSVPLRIGVDKERSLLGGSKARREINRGRRFSDSTLLICNCNYSRHEFTVKVWRLI